MDDLDKICNFILKYSPYTDKEKIKEFIQLHLKYKTCLIVYNEKNEIIAVARWNILPSGKTAHILDLIIRPDYRNKGFIKKMLIKGLEIWKEVKYLCWDRLEKYPARETRMYSVEQLLRR
jgi:N-acetylglutamate synthase-like GNAT family acetyltransferase